MVNIVQNRNYEYSKSKQYHEFFICTHKNASFRSGLGTEVFTPYQLPKQAYYIFNVHINADLRSFLHLIAFDGFYLPDDIKNLHMGESGDYRRYLVPAASLDPFGTYSPQFWGELFL